MSLPIKFTTTTASGKPLPLKKTVAAANSYPADTVMKCCFLKLSAAIRGPSRFPIFIADGAGGTGGSGGGGGACTGGAGGAGATTGAGGTGGAGGGGGG